MPSRPANIAAGFTLIELILVLLVMAVLAALAASTLRGFGRSGGVANSADQVVALAQWGRTQAITRGVSFRLNFDPNARTYWLTMQTGPSFVPPTNSTLTATSGSTTGGVAATFDEVGEEMGRVFNAPEGVTIECNLPQQSDGLYIEFHPTGRTDPGVVRLSDPDGHVSEVGSLSATESVHVLSDDERQQEQLQPNANQQPAYSR